MTTKTNVITLTVLAASLTTGTATIQDLSDDASSPMEVKLDQLTDETREALALTEESPLLNTQSTSISVIPESTDGDTTLYALHKAEKVKPIPSHAPTSPLHEKSVW